MAGQVMDGQVQVRCRFTLLAVLGCRIHARYGEHTGAEVTGIVRCEDADGVLMDTADERIEILGRSDAAGSTAAWQILFSGIIKKAELTKEGGYAAVSLHAVSRTWKMDIRRRSRSFQNGALTYRDIAGTVAQEYGARLDWKAANGRPGHPLIQHNETDYRFLQRVAGHLQAGLTAGDAGQEIRLCAGMGGGTDRGILRLEGHTYSIVPYYAEKNGKKQQGWQRGYRIADAGFTRAGDSLQIDGRIFYVMEADTVFVRGALEYSCLVFPENCFRVEKIPARTLQGAVLTGRVLAAGQEFVKLHLDIDREQPVSEAYEFPWKPLTGNIFYCMPEKGTRAALYFGRADESSGEAVCSIRENGGQCAELADCNDRYFTADNAKRMYLKPSEMGLLCMEGRNAEIALKDASALDIRTSGKISVMAQGQVELKGKSVTVKTPVEATLVRKDLLSPTVVNLCNAFDSIGKNGGFAAAPQVAEKKKRGTGSVYPAESYPLEEAIETVLSNIPVDDMESPLMEAAAAAMPAICSGHSIRNRGQGK